MKERKEKFARPRDAEGGTDGDTLTSGGGRGGAARAQLQGERQEQQRGAALAPHGGRGPGRAAEDGAPLRSAPRRLTGAAPGAGRDGGRRQAIGRGCPGPWGRGPRRAVGGPRWGMAWGWARRERTVGGPSREGPASVGVSEPGRSRRCCRAPAKPAPVGIPAGACPV